MPPKVVEPAIAYNEVSTENFRALYPIILEKIAHASYIAIDTEFTGHGERVATNMEHRYKTISAVIRTHAILSFGMTIINRTDEPNVFSVHNFEFLTSNQEDFCVTPQNLKFLADNGLDFTRHFSVGIPYKAGTQSNPEPYSLRQLWCSILQIIRQKQIPIVVHNGILDLMYIYQSFIADLPQALQPFIADLTEIFSGGIYDTKYLASHVTNEPKTFLAYLYCKYDRLNHGDHSFSIRVEDPLPVPELSLADQESPKRLRDNASTPLSRSQKRRRRLRRDAGDESSEGGVCAEYAQKGWCHRGKSCPRSHDLQLILDKDDIPPRPVKADEASVTTSDNTQSENETSTNTVAEDSVADVPTPTSEQEEPKKRRDHAAHFDAYMTAFVFCHFGMTLGKTLSSHINRLNIVRLHVPLRIEKSAYTKPSVAWTELRDRLWDDAADSSISEETT
ncbi:ribonuclease CAF1 [Radiomyces spectabilis]|uniref:ribonuclease CAF1 n=1 Tax=Radiomyces spectabilis TaxID=64574 RepID=UPI00221F4E9F|nr:ribonuclease CAF1 [Radiomyces spectabilis]KAI8377394.1 ribonuclease CAF1 [Radiomyces spectabilis]